MPDWQQLSSEEIYKTPWIRVRRDRVLNHNGKPLTYSVVELNHPSVFIVATNARNEILIQQSYRYTIDRMVWEIPTGHSDGEDLLKAAQRELLEETGYTSEDWVDLGDLYQSIGIGNIPLKAFLARNVQKTNNRHDELEDIGRQIFMSLNEIETLVHNGEFNNAPVLAVLYLAKSNGL